MAAAYGVAVSSTVTGIYSIVGTIGNGLVILTFCTYRQVRTSAHTFILSISISDVMITGFQYPVSTASAIIGAPSLGHAMCPMIGALFYFSIYISLLSMVLIAFNRCIRVTKSTETYRKLFSPFRSFLWVVLSWVVSGLLVAPGFLGYGEFGWNKNSQICALMDKSSYSRDYVSNIYGLFYLIVFCVVIAIVVLFMLYRMNYVLNPFLYAWKLPVFRRAFKALVRCKRQLPFQPGAPVWSNHSAAALQRVKVAFHDALKIMTSQPRSTSNSCLFALMRVDTFDARRRQLTHSFAARLMASENDIITVLSDFDVIATNQRAHLELGCPAEAEDVQNLKKHSDTIFVEKSVR
ncbi:opsin-1, short-wave-sensitive 1-like [Branchiostoma floridae]|uniref:Opsin-1, short-wave-sensitive 1-like n=1 Tax=Branchiostoma floridae TaxID=7739 RepID=A0A9J7L7X5_BRAFL|nr:opsin-1, short-wave-sensitive 1-like [Branchiostoma floridae]